MVTALPSLSLYRATSRHEPSYGFSRSFKVLIVQIRQILTESTALESSAPTPPEGRSRVPARVEPESLARSRRYTDCPQENYLSDMSDQ